MRPEQARREPPLLSLPYRNSNKRLVNKPFSSTATLPSDSRLKPSKRPHPRGSLPRHEHRIYRTDRRRLTLVCDGKQRLHRQREIPRSALVPLIDSRPNVRPLVLALAGESQIVFLHQFIFLRPVEMSATKSGRSSDRRSGKLIELCRRHLLPA